MNISLDQPDKEIVEAIINATSTIGIHVIVDYLWGRPNNRRLVVLPHRSGEQG